jgi:hypothetical protein
VNGHAAIEEVVFSLGALPSLYNEDLQQLELELSQVPKLAVAAKNWESECSVLEGSALAC